MHDALPRNTERKPVRAEALICYEDRTAIGWSRNLSNGGVYLEVEQAVTVGEELRLLLGDEARSRILRVTAQVVHVDEGVGFGARFVTRSPMAKRAVDDFIERLTSRLPAPGAHAPHAQSPARA